jgi:hypothetical protein
MKPVPTRHTRLLIDHHDFSLDTASLTLTLAADAIDAPALQMDALQRIPGNPSAKLEHNGYYTGPDAGQLEAELAQRLGSTTPVTLAVLFDTRTPGNPAYVLENIWGEQLTLDTPIDKLLTLAGAWAEMPAYRGLTLYDGALTAIGAGPVLTLPTTAASARAWLFVSAITGATAGIDINLYSDDNPALPDPAAHGLITFNAVGVYPLDLANTPIQRYISFSLDDLGGADALTCTLVAAFPGITM